MPVGGLAAAVAVGVGIWAANRPSTTTVAPDVAAGPRHELLEKVVAIDSQLAKARTPQERIPLLAKMAEALKAETAGVYKAAKTTDEVRSLTGKFEKVVTEGIVRQATKLREDKFAPVAERHQVLAAAADALGHYQAEADLMATTAPPQVKGSLEQMAKAAKAGREELERLRRDA
jgi:hypothetical protein